MEVTEKIPAYSNERERQARICQAYLELTDGFCLSRSCLKKSKSAAEEGTMECAVWQAVFG